MSILGWSLPAGADLHPFAPYNQDDGWTEDHCPECKQKYSEAILAILETGEEPPLPYPYCSEKCQDTDCYRQEAETEALAKFYAEDQPY